MLKYIIVIALGWAIAGPVVGSITAGMYIYWNAEGKHKDDDGIQD